MLIMPEHSDPLRVAGVDPGTANVGVACLESLLNGEAVYVADAFTLFAKDSRQPYCNIAELHGNRTARLMNLGDQLLEFFREYRPHAVVVESNYLGASVDSFRALVESVCMVRNALYAYNPLIPLYVVDPSTVKKVAGIKGKIPKGVDKKEVVREALRKHVWLSWGVDIDDLDEHSIDGIAIGLYFIRNLLTAT